MKIEFKTKDAPPGGYSACKVYEDEYTYLSFGCRGDYGHTNEEVVCISFSPHGRSNEVWDGSFSIKGGKDTKVELVKILRDMAEGVFGGEPVPNEKASYFKSTPKSEKKLFSYCLTLLLELGNPIKIINTLIEEAKKIGHEEQKAEFRRMLGIDKED